MNSSNEQPKFKRRATTIKEKVKPHNHPEEPSIHFSELIKKMEELSDKRKRLEYEYERNIKELEEIKNSALEEFGVNSVDELEIIFAKMKKEEDEALKDFEQKLEAEDWLLKQIEEQLNAE